MFKPLEKLHRLYDGYMAAHKIDNLDVLLIQYDGKIYGFKNNCPHQNVPLTYGTLENGNIRCPLHGFEFRLRDGRPVMGACAALESVDLVYNGNVVGVDYQVDDR
ncbi:Rieske (2Fe-2S) protein [Sessilibacter sp. MAH2]